MIVTPVSFSPSIIAWCIGAPPRYFGNNEAWTLIQPSEGASKSSFGNICPNAAVMTISGCNERICCSSSDPRSFSGCIIGNPSSNAAALTGGGVNIRLRPTGRSGCVTTALISYPSSCSIRKMGAEKSGVPIKIIEVILFLLFCIHFFKLFCC